MLTLDDAIKHCEEVATENEKTIAYYTIQGDKDWLDECEKDCIECAKEHRQLAEWLKALKEIWDSGDCNDCRNGQCEWKPRLGQLVRFNCPHYVGVANKEVNADDTKRCDN